MKPFDLDNIHKLYSTSNKLTIGVFCSSSQHIDDIYKTQAAFLGELLAKNNYDVIHGGGKVGLMGVLAQSVQKHGGKVTGILPESLNIEGIASETDDEIIITKDMTDRKYEMRKRSNGFIVLPGGFGTLEEFFETLTLIQLGYTNKPLILLNINNYYNLLLQFIDEALQKKFITESDLLHFHISHSCEDAIEYMNNHLKI
ncbi:MAG: TIGR00730 family Rossman fold protein [Bacteroidales bacterium]|nr:TIGR00730 family Rossman fold protein [Bacteroidales bacterium]